MHVDSIERGLVIDHITAGKGMDIVNLLELDKMDCPVAVIRNARSGKTGRKDIVKIEDEVDINLDVLGFVDPKITVNVIVGSQIVEKRRLAHPKKVVNVAKCMNPRCITSTERELDQIFEWQETSEVYRCAYCEQAYE